MKLYKDGVDKEGKAVIEMGPDKYITADDAIFEVLNNIDVTIFNKVLAKCKPRKDLGKDVT